MHNEINLNHEDPIKRIVEKQSEQEEFSPMDPPDAFAPPHLDHVDEEDFHPFIREFVEEHKACIHQLDLFDQALTEIRSSGYTREIHDRISDFFRFFDEKIVKHNQREERSIFPVLKERLLETRVADTVLEPLTGVDIMEDDHIKVLQLAAIVFNFLGLSVRLPDMDSRMMVLDAGIEQGKALIEMLRLHIFREDNVLFVQAHQLLSAKELDELSALQEA